MSAQLSRQSDRIDALLDELSSISSPGAMEKINELIGLLVNLYGDGLGRLIRRVATSGLEGDAVAAICGDELICGLLVLHDIHPLSLSERVDRALRTETGVEVLALDDGRLELHLVTEDPAARRRIEALVAAAAPEIAAIEYSTIRPGGRSAGRLHLPIVEDRQ